MMHPYRGKVFLLLVLSLPLVIFLPGMQGFFYPAKSLYSDVAVSHYPNIRLIQDALGNWGVIPTWSEAILSGYPFIADPLSGIWYPPGMILWLLPLPFGINLLILFHLFFGGTGMVLFLKAQGVTDISSLAGGLCYLLMPKMVAHFAAGHITLVFGFAWLPWLVLYEFKRSRGEAGQFIPGVVVFAVIILADVRVAVYSALLWGGYRFFLQKHILVENLKPFERMRYIIQLIGGLTMQGVVAVLATSPFFLPFMEFLFHSKRTGMTTTDTLIFSLAPVRMIGLVVPDLGGAAEWLVYPGTLSFICLVIVTSHAPLRKKCAFWLGLAVASMLLSLGDNLPLVRYLFSLPGLNLLRVPSRFLFLAFLSMSIMTGFTLDEILAWGNGLRKRFAFWMSVPAMFLILLSAGIWMLSKRPPVEWCWSALSFALFTVVLFTGSQEYRVFSKRMVLILPFLVFDLAGADITLFTVKPSEEVLSEGAMAARYLSQQARTFRVYSPSYSIPQQTSINHNLEFASGVDPIQLKSYVEFMCGATGVECLNYSVTLPPFNSGNPDMDNRLAVPDVEKLGILNIEYIASEFEINCSSLQLLQIINGTYVYKNPNSLPRAWVQKTSEVVERVVRPVINIRRRPNHYLIEAEGPGVLVLSVNHYPGWEVKVNGEKGGITLINQLLMGVEIPAGISTVEFHYFPRLLVLGVILSLFVITGIALHVFLSKKQ